MVYVSDLGKEVQVNHSVSVVSDSRLDLCMLRLWQQKTRVSVRRIPQHFSFEILQSIINGLPFNRTGFGPQSVGDYISPLVLVVRFMKGRHSERRLGYKFKQNVSREHCSTSQYRSL